MADLISTKGMSRKQLRSEVFKHFGPLLFVNPSYGGKCSHILAPLSVPAFTGGVTHGHPREIGWVHGDEEHSSWARGQISWVCSQCGGWDDQIPGCTKEELLITNTPESRAYYYPPLPLCKNCVASYERLTDKSISAALWFGEILQEELDTLLDEEMAHAPTAEDVTLLMKKMLDIEDEVTGRDKRPVIPGESHLQRTLPDPEPQEMAGMIYLDCNPGHKLEGLLRQPLALVYSHTEKRYLVAEDIGSLFKHALDPSGEKLTSFCGMLAIPADGSCVVDLEKLQKDFMSRYELHEISIYYKQLDTERLRARKLVTIRGILGDHFGPVSVQLDDSGRVVVEFTEEG